MKKTLLVALLLCVSLFSSALCEAAAPAAEPIVYVSINDGEGVLALAAQPVAVTDTDADGALTIHDALTCAHAEAFPEGTEGYLAAKSEFGLSLLRLWGVENGGSCGYYLNDASAWSLLDPVQAGDHVKAFSFTDLVGFTDTYCFFNAFTVEAKVGAEVPLTLTAAAFDENWSPITLPVAGAALLVDGQAAEVLTDAEGKAVLTFAAPGTYIVTADSETLNLVDPKSEAKRS